MPGQPIIINNQLIPISNVVGKVLSQFSRASADFSSVVGRTGVLTFDDGITSGQKFRVYCCTLDGATITAADGTADGSNTGFHSRVELTVGASPSILSGVIQYVNYLGQLNCNIEFGIAVNCVRQKLEVWAYSSTGISGGGPGSADIRIIWFHGEVALCDFAAGTNTVSNLVSATGYYDPPTDSLIWRDTSGWSGATSWYLPGSTGGSAVLTLLCDTGGDDISGSECADCPDLCTLNKCVHGWRGTLSADGLTWSGWSALDLRFGTPDASDPGWGISVEPTIDADLLPVYDGNPYPLDRIVYTGQDDDGNCDFIYYKLGDCTSQATGDSCFGPLPSAPTDIPTKCRPCTAFAASYDAVISGTVAHCGYNRYKVDGGADDTFTGIAVGATTTFTGQTPAITQYQDDGMGGCSVTPEVVQPTFNPDVTIDMQVNQNVSGVDYTIITGYTDDGSTQVVLWKAMIDQSVGWSTETCCGLPKTITASLMGVDSTYNPAPVTINGTITLTLNNCPPGGEDDTP